MYLIVSVAVENATIAFDKEYEYVVPENMADAARRGCRCTVPFGGGNKKRTGIILNVGESKECEKLKPVSAILDDAPLFGDEGYFLLSYIRETTFCTWFDALRLLIPAGIGIKYETVYSIGKNSGFVPDDPLSREISEFIKTKRAPITESALRERFGARLSSDILYGLVESGTLLKKERARRRVSDEKQTMARLLNDCGDFALTPKQKSAAEFLREAKTASLKEICYYTGVTRSVVDALVKKGVAEYYECVTLRNPYADAEAAGAPTALSSEQQAVYVGLEDLYESEKRAPALLYGVTGSGKTEVFLRLVEHVVSKGRTAIVLVPEISLTAQAIKSFHKRFGGRVATIHSGLSQGERMDEWRRISDGGADIVIGTRSAVFAPLKNIGLIVIDEEQEHTYKSDKAPRYHARDVALRRCAYNGAQLLLSSATPSIESFYAAKSGKYRLFELATRFNQSHLPDVQIVDMREPANVSAYPAISSVLLEELHDNLARNEQSILLLNRRGHSTTVKCSSCGSVAQCPNCSVSLTYHNANGSLVCHYCGYLRPVGDELAVCGDCGGKFVRYAGVGTQKLEEELKLLFPDARILRVDMDTTMSKLSHEKLFGAFSAGEYDIMLGTQMVSKGLNFPNVTLVGVLQADQSLYAGDYKSFERTFSLLTQVVGRGGRGDKRGRACIQTYYPDNPIIMLAANQDYHAFYEQESKLRRLHLYPPFCTLCCIGFSGESLDEVCAAADMFADRFKKTANEAYPDLPVRMLGPSPSEILRAAGKYRYKLIIKCKNNTRTRQMLRELLRWFAAESKRVGAFIDMHY